jgi:hypothetical protein
VFFSNFAWEDDEPVDEWMEEPVKELAALMVRPLEQLQDFRLVSVPGPGAVEC